MDQSNFVPESRAYRGMSTVDNSVSDWGRYDISIIKQDLINHFHIRQGEKLNDPTFGTIIWDILYEPLTEQVKRLVLEDVSRIINYDPRVAVNSILVDSYDTGIQVACELTFLPFNITESLTFKFDENDTFLK